MIKLSTFGLFEKSENLFLVGGILFCRFVPVDVQKSFKLSAFLVGSVMVVPSVIIADTLPSFLVFLVFF